MTSTETLNNNKKEEEEESSEISIKTAESEINELAVKHPLQNAWTLWWYDAGSSKNWEENQREILSFETIEDFWSLYNHIRVASDLRIGCDYSVFKKGIRPMWEDTANRNGGRWLISFERRQRGQELDRNWLDVVLLLIGEAFDADSEEICGAVVNIRTKGDKIGIWTGDASRGNAVQAIGHKLKSRLNCSRLEYLVHKDSEKKTGSVTKFLYQI